MKINVIKSNSYNVIDSEPFDIPMPVEFELYSGNILLVEYRITPEGMVDYSFNPAMSDKILTKTNRPLMLSDIYFLILSRIVSEKSPFAALETECFGLAEYNVFELFRKTRGIMPYDQYWFRFSDDDINEVNYKKIMAQHRETREHFNTVYFERQQIFFSEMAVQAEMYRAEAERAEQILRQREENIQDLVKNSAEAALNETDLKSRDAETVKKKEEVPTVSVVTPSLAAADSLFEELKYEAFDAEEDLISAMLATPEIPSSNGTMSDDAIAALFAKTNDGGEKAEEELISAMPASPEIPSSNGTMSDDAIAALFAKTSNGEKAEEDLISAISATPEIPPSNEKMSDDAIAALFAKTSDGGEKAEEEIISAISETPEIPPSNGTMSDDAIAALFAKNNTD